MVVVPDVADTLVGDRENVRAVAVRLAFESRIDPVLSPIGFGFAASLGRYLEARRLFPDAEMMMGIGNLTELTDADSAAINVLLLGFCQEVGIRSVLDHAGHQLGPQQRERMRPGAAAGLSRGTTQTLPKHAEPGLVLLRDPRVHEHGAETLEQLARDIKDPNYRIFAERRAARDQRESLSARDRSVRVARQLQAAAARPLDAAHAFYLGYELAKAHTALTLGKDYRQDQALDWGFLTVEERATAAAQRQGETVSGSEGCEPSGRRASTRRQLIDRHADRRACPWRLIDLRGLTPSASRWRHGMLSG